MAHDGSAIVYDLSRHFSCLNKQESLADAGIPVRRKNDEKNSPISKL